MSHGLQERKPLLSKGFKSEDYPVKLHINTKQNILSSFLLAEAFILHHSLSSQTNLRKMFPSHILLNANSATLNMEYSNLPVLFLLVGIETIF